jgi:spermidine synthase
MSFASLTHAEREGFWNLWFSELHKGHVGMTYKVKSILYSGQSRFQRIDVLDTYEYGRMLVLYGSVMFTEKDEFVYHEMLSHVPFFSARAPSSALVIGGGDGFTLRELLKHRSLESLTLVDIDEMVIERCKEFFPDSRASFEDPRVTVTFADGAEFVREQERQFDLILVDAADPVPPADVLFQPEFHASCKKLLAPGGVFAAQTESPFYNPDVFGEVFSSLSDLYKVCMPYLAWIPTYPSALWSFAFCSDDRHPVHDFDRDAFLESGIDTRWYNEDIHAAAFALPTFVRQML